ncbi:diacylglycerol [Stylonychia lemnae]|uniref:Diacylglycerol n=1 Tax=Stylonychia lemnae TaxID=5949 RepID=A0A078B7D6_STYLE|nr:diacylglycerol [Stylonychia lemnae]|eukprot:CDW90395.1 diacylglycerol [Stylonychia lemnae]
MERSSSKIDNTSLNGQNSIQLQFNSLNQDRENKKNGEEQQNQGKKRTYIQDILNTNEKVNKTNVKNESPIKKQHQQQAHVQIILIVNPRSVACNMKIYDVTKPEEREKYTNLIEKILPTGTNQLILAILGGDGSLPQVIKQIRQREIINNNLIKITFCSLPFGTGNDTGATFGWGLVPGPYAESIDTLINSFIWAYKDQLTFWEVNVDGEIYTPFDERTENVFGLCCYFNIGIDGEIGNGNIYRIQNFIKRLREDVQGQDVQIFGYIFTGDQLRSLISVSIQTDKSNKLCKRQKVLTDLSLVNHEPLNLCGMNMPQMMGGKVYYDFWNKNKENKLFDREKILKKHGIDFLGWDTETASSCDDTDDQIQRYDDDKMELVGAPDWLQFSTFNYHRYGQAKSPFQVEFREDLDHDKIIYMANDGEYFKLKKLKKITFRTDPKAPKLNMLRFNPDCMI